MRPEDLSLSAVADSIRRGELSAERYAARLLERCTAAAPLNAFISQEPERVLAAARRADARRAAGSAMGPLHGVPLALKDNLDTIDLATTGGTPALRQNRPRRNAMVVERLLEAGAIVLGKTNMHELAFGVTNHNAAFGPARNPHDPARIPGGSSGGTGVAVAARLAPAGIGTDTGGSIRVPAALCGIVGFRPTTGRWPRTGIIPISHTRDTAGPMTRTVADALLLDEVITGADIGNATTARTAPSGALQGLRLGIPRAHFYEDLDPSVAAAITAVLERLEAAGVVLIEGDIREVTALDHAAGFPIALHEAVTDLAAYLRDHDLPLTLEQLVASVASPDVRGILEGILSDRALSGDAYDTALLVARPALQRAYRAFFAELDVVAAIFPTTPLPAACIGEDDTCELNGKRLSTFLTFTRNTGPGSLAGIPGVSLPAGATPAGLPIGIALDGAPGDDRRLLAIAAALEPLLPSPPQPPEPLPTPD